MDEITYPFPNFNAYTVDKYGYNFSLTMNSQKHPLPHPFRVSLICSESTRLLYSMIYRFVIFAVPVKPEAKGTNYDICFYKPQS